MKKLIQAAVAFGLLAFSTAAALAHEFKVGDLEISHPFSRAMLPGAKVAGGYMKITNHGASPDRLVSATSSFAGETQIHEMKVENDIMTMKELANGLEIPPGQSVELKPGGLHVMFMNVAVPSKEGDMIKATLTFEKAGTVEVEFMVGSANPSADHKHDHSGDHKPEHHAHAATADSVQSDDPQVAIPNVMKAIFETPENKLAVDPVVVQGDFAIAGWVQGDKGGRALLKKGHNGWAIHLCSGDSLKEAAGLATLGMPNADAEALADKLASAESALDPETLKLFASFEGTVMMGDGNDHATQHGHKP